jgi:XisI protein
MWRSVNISIIEWRYSVCSLTVFLTLRCQRRYMNDSLELAIGQTLVADRISDVEQYRQIIEDVLMRQVGLPTIGGEIQTVPVFDREGDRYQLLDIGWDHLGRRVFQPIVHVDLVDGKVWIQENMTDLDIVKVFMQAGIKSSQIVLGFYSRSQRELGDYAIE